MTYNEFIQNIIDTRGQWAEEIKICGERHHIRPVCIGGKPNRFRKWVKHPNCIWLTVEEHYIAHKLLAMENPEIKELQQAWNCMHITRDGKNISQEEYISLRENYLRSTPGKNAPFYGHKHNPEYVEILRERVKGKNNPMYGRTGDKNPRYGVEVGEETRKKMSLAKSDMYLGKDNPQARKVINITTGEIFDTLRDASKAMSCSESHLRKYIKNNKLYHHNNLMYYDDYIKIGGDNNV